MNRHLIGLAAAAALVLAPASVQASTSTPGPPPGALHFTVDAGPGDQTDPHVSGHFVTYTSEASGDSAVRVYDLKTGNSDAVPRTGGLDFLSDVSSAGVVYTHLEADSEIRRYDPSSGDLTTLTAPGANSREARGGGTTVVWQDFGYTGDVTTPELTVYDTATGIASRLTNDQMLDKDPAVSPDGSMIVWTKCRPDGTGCAIWEADRSGSGWSTHPVTLPADGQAGLPDTDGHVVVYSLVANGEEDVYWWPVGGRPHELSLPGQQTNPNVSNGVITYEQLDTTTQVPNYDIYAYDIATGTTYRLTETPEDETLNDVYVDGRFVTVVWTKSELDDNVYGESFTLPPLAATVSLPSVAWPGGVTMLVQDAAGEPLAGTTVRYRATGAFAADGSCVTGGDGTCTLSYGSSTPNGRIDFTAYADTNLDGAQDGNEPGVLSSWTIEADTTPPAVSVDGFSDGQQLVLGSPPPNVTCSSSDSGSGIASTTGPTEQSSLTANGVGTVSYTCTATDKAGNTASDTKTYDVVYAFGGLWPKSVLHGRAGRAFPLTWQLRDANGGYVGALSAVASLRYRPASCTDFSPSGSPADAASAGRSGLRYVELVHAYEFTWKTPKTAGCYVVALTLDSGQSFTADVRLS